MSALVRAFIAVPVPAVRPLADCLRELRTLGRAVKAVTPEQLHVTLKFLGPTPAEAIPQLAGRLAHALAERRAWTCRLRGLNAFPRPERPQVVWAGCEDPAPLMELAKIVEDVGEACGYARERRAFHPHVTLARVNGAPPASMRQLISDLSASPLGMFQASRVVLMESRLQRAGAAYHPLASFQLTSS